jgi:ferric-dicitrate binding protein FerR (iron transport regulator)
MVLLCVGTYFLTKTKAPKRVAVSTKILPGKEGAILTLADGSRISLDSIQNGVVAMQGGTTAKIVNGTLLYEGKGSEAVYNVMSTPKARKFHVILPDGTNAWLNSASSIQYPTAFTGRERKVAITGEVYFEVAPLIPKEESHKVPFIVNVNNQAEIEVLGTHFDVKAYENEPVINTTLLEGVVRITRNTEHVTLHPGQQAQIVISQQKMLVDGAPAKEDDAKKAQGLTVLNNTDIDKVMAWKNGVFDFNNIAFADAMHQLERWYDIQVVYEKGIPTDIELNGKMTKDVPLNDLVTILEKIGVKCRLEGRKLLIQS